MAMARVVLDEYSNRVINVVKAKYALNDKSEALNKFIHLYGAEEDVEEEVSEKVAKEVIDSCNRHFKKYGFRTTSIEELRKSIEG
jgi:hypothetical protein